MYPYFSKWSDEFEYIESKITKNDIEQLNFLKERQAKTNAYVNDILLKSLSKHNTWILFYAAVSVRTIKTGPLF